MAQLTKANKEQSTGSKTPCPLCREVKGGGKKDRELDSQGIGKEVEEARFHNKTHLVCKGIRWITAKYDPHLQVIKDGQGHLLTEPGVVK